MPQMRKHLIRNRRDPHHRRLSQQTPRCPEQEIHPRHLQALQVHRILPGRQQHAGEYFRPFYIKMSRYRSFLAKITFIFLSSFSRLLISRGWGVASLTELFTLDEGERSFREFLKNEIGIGMNSNTVL